MGQEVLQVQHGIWIDEQWIQDAGLKGRLRILVQPGEIRIFVDASYSLTPLVSISTEISNCWVK